eukprot:ANDGO_02919.mRNA.1 hypothetical protein
MAADSIDWNNLLHAEAVLEELKSEKTAIEEFLCGLEKDIEQTALMQLRYGSAVVGPVKLEMHAIKAKKQDELKTVGSRIELLDDAIRKNTVRVRAHFVQAGTGAGAGAGAGAGGDSSSNGSASWTNSVPLTAALSGSPTKPPVVGSLLEKSHKEAIIRIRAQKHQRAHQGDGPVVIVSQSPILRHSQHRFDKPNVIPY